MSILEHGYDSAYDQGWDSAKRASSPLRRVSSSLWKHASAGGLPETSRLVLRTVRAPRAMLRWFAMLSRLCTVCGVEAIPFDLARKPSQSFFQNQLSQTSRALLIARHYQKLLTRLGAARTAALVRGETIHLTTMRGRSDAVYRLDLSRTAALNRREGELNLCLTQGGQRLATLTLVIGAWTPGSADDLWIGGLQGARGGTAKADTVAATRDLHGLRPKDLLMHAIYPLADLFSVGEVWGVCNARHVHRRPEAGKAWAADYDSYWRELGGEPHANGCFRLPRRRPERDMAAAPAAKRKALIARKGLIDGLRQNVARIGGAA